METGEAITIRPATTADEARLEWLAAIDSAAPLVGDVLIGERGEEAVAAVAIGSGLVVANPFRATTDVVALLLTRRRNLTIHPGGGSRAAASSWRELMSSLR